ncbi:MAG: lipoyl(octanoyl) transferase LipB [Leptospiraceae bacterium]|nr:lipoyl(octanoyl) transferase LipB [Leptospiraceae bacterium]
MKFTKKINSVPYNKYLRLQTSLRKKRKEILIFLEHTSTITAGSNYNIENLLVPKEYLLEKGIAFFQVERGGDLTAHEIGQLVIYPHIDLKKRNLTIGDYLQFLTNCLIDSIEEVWKLSVISHKDKPGLYLTSDHSKKLLSMGVYFKSYFTSYGVALNLRNDLSVFRMINPCGQDAANMVSLLSLGLDVSGKKEEEFVRVFGEKFRLGIV